jgi:hypothetical protein
MKIQSGYILLAKINKKFINNFIRRLYKRMFKDLQSGLMKFFTGERIVLFIVLIILAWGIYTYAGSKSFSVDGMEDGQSNAQKQPSMKETSAQFVVPAPPATEQSTSNGGYSQQAVANPSDLLPNDQNSQWAALNPGSMNKGNIAMPDLLQAGYHIGLDTIGQTLRNANLQERSDPVIPKSLVGPWNQSTIEPDLGRVPLEVGYGCR